MKTIDFHTHILPAIDDGSRNIQTSIEMVQRCRSYNVDTIIATPHFYAHQDRSEQFLQRREAAYRKLTATLSTEESAISIQLGAEVAFFSGISNAETIEDLTIEGTNVLLLEMPFDRWGKDVIREVERLITDRHLQIVLAHIERFYKIPDNSKKIRELLELPLYAQINASSLTDWRQRRRIIKLFKEGKAHLLGSDCHGIHHRPPNLGEGRDVILKKCGRQMLEKIDETGTRLLGGIEL